MGLPSGYDVKVHKVGSRFDLRYFNSGKLVAELDIGQQEPKEKEVKLLLTHLRDAVFEPNLVENILL